MPNGLAPLVALAATVLLIIILRPLAIRTGLVDIPNARKSHGEPTPLVGGLAIFGGMVLGYFLCRSGGVALGPREVYSFFGAGLLLIAVGVVDDFLELSPAVKFAAQIVAALLMIFGAGVVLTDVGALTTSGDLLQLGVLAVPFTVFASLGIINALNMSDGLDGLSGSLTLTSLSGLMLAAYLWGAPADTALLTDLGAAILGFLLFNRRLLGRKRASVFMGDAGSMFLGFAVTWYAISLSQGETRALHPSAALWFLMVPIFDAVTMMLRRMLKGRSPFSADREHLHHIFLMAGYTVNETVAMIVGLASAGVLVGLASMYFQIPDVIVAGVFVFVGLGYFWMISRSWKAMRFMGRPISRRQNAADRRVDPAGSYAGPERRSGCDRRDSLPVAQAAASKPAGTAKLDVGPSRPAAASARRRGSALGRT